MARLTSILDNDFYKFTMQYAVVKLFPKAKARYQFINRGKHAFPAGFAEKLREAINHMAELKLSKSEKSFFAKTCPYIDPTYFDFLQGYQYDPDEVTITQDGPNLEVHIEGYWYRTILWEVPVMALICELYYEVTGQERVSDKEVAQIVNDKMDKYDKLNITIADFGTRRRHSYAVHDLVIKALREHQSNTFIGTSNVHFAMKYKTKPIGTHAHEWFMFHAAKYGYKMANLLGLEHWADVYRGDLGIALSDTYTTEAFFKQFDKKLTKLFDGVRHDSGDPIEFAKMTIKHYESKGINPLNKTIIFSDGLDYEKVVKIVKFCDGKIGHSFGIGTDFTNDVGLKRMNIVLKMTEAYPDEGEWTPVIKLSDEPLKHTGDPEEIKMAMRFLNISDHA
ncbi:nicotinate phosphoribosyltransferase [Sphingobacterium sp. DK4209]|uniref:Nicotinate phosphoribosyltransferase n=1 Tax=Sphingobacterium zhuxiongii TaxID=2662364 RepID=A0A5Q0QBP6_9SPHI|nr:MULTISPECIES: nicotinate phosphoribosyltransferase [unclassified Sphingobacterium]MVZ66468.1 nicotinate phosphoribosyltransferase [Sphingobacterium sp. DK4209]QGA27315.1 nicotinate phosphoribosyltransferase [Sphingobacterium sp. dk4302]